MPDDEQERMKRVASQAEEAVQSVKDPELRKVAYEKVLARLLDEGPSSRRRVESSNPRFRAPTDAKPKARSGPMVWLREMVEEGFFKKPKTAPEILARLKEAEHHLEYPAITGQLKSLCNQHILRRVSASDEKGKRAAWVNW